MRIIQSIPRDSIPAVDDPEFGAAYTGDPDDTLIVIEGESTTRGYPTRHLDFHEIVNDEISGDPIAVTWCPLCGSGIAYEATVNGQDLTFGVSGKLADDNLVMYDRQTESEWKQSTGQCIAGEYEGRSLTVLPAAMMTYRAFRESYPDGLVLNPPGGSSVSSGADRDLGDIDYDDSPFEAYFDTDAIGRDAFYDSIGREPDEHYQGPRSWDRADLRPKEIVLGIEANGDALAFPRSRVEEAGGVVQTTVGGQPIVVFSADGLHAFQDPGYTFDPTGPGEFRADGTTWAGNTGESEDGRTLERLQATRAFAFTWQDDHGAETFYNP